jgi:hypothetical protein
MKDVPTSPPMRHATRVSGRAVVVGMFIFGIAATSILWMYWKLHTGPFRPFQDALAVEFPGSVPRVEGGQRKMHKGTPRILRVTLRVDFDPEADAERGVAVLARVENVAARYVDLSEYEVLQAFLYHGVPEKDLRQREFDMDLRKWGTARPSSRLNQNLH